MNQRGVSEGKGSKIKVAMQNKTKTEKGKTLPSTRSANAK